jgi:hypothetical protein
MSVLRLSSICFTAFLTVFAVTHRTNAQQADSVDKLITLMKEAADEAGRACGKEIDDFCERVTPGEGRVVSCVMAFEDQLSDGCRLALFDIATLIGSTETFFEYAAEVCEPDIETLCGNVEVGEGRIAKCMLEQKASASQQCQEAIDAFEGKLK